MIVMDCNAYKTNIQESILIQINNLNTLIRKKKGQLLLAGEVHLMNKER